MTAYDYGYPDQRSSTCVLKIRVIDVNDNVPHFGRSTITRHVSEGVAVGTAVTTVTATDVDINHVLNYYFLAGGNPGNAFSMHAHSGQITVAHELDYERQNYYELAVGVSDISNNSTMQVFVHVDDDNDNSPVFSHSSYQVGTLQLLGTL